MAAISGMEKRSRGSRRLKRVFRGLVHKVCAKRMNEGCMRNVSCGTILDQRASAI